MKKAEKQSNRRSQRDYSLAFKLQVVRQVEKGELTYKKASATMAFKAEVPYWSG
jgi:transposase